MFKFAKFTSYQDLSAQRLLFYAFFALLLVVLMTPILALLIGSVGGLEWLGIRSLRANFSMTTLFGLSVNTLKLIALTLVGAAAMGVSAALIVTQFEFPLRRLLSWLLMLPLAVPAYIIAFAYTDMLEYAGPIQTLLREVMGYQSPRDYWFPQIRSYLGAATMLSFVLYPYVYLTTRTALMQHSQNAYDAANLLGDSLFDRFYKITLPLLVPALFAGLALVAMETLADFGTVNYFGLSVLTKGLFDLVQNRGDLTSASQLALAAISLIFIIFTIERYYRAQTQALRSSYTRKSAIRVSRPIAALFILLCSLPIILGLLLPLGYFISIANFDFSFDGALGQAMQNSALLSFSACLL